MSNNDYTKGKEGGNIMAKPKKQDQTVMEEVVKFCEEHNYPKPEGKVVEVKPIIETEEEKRKRLWDEAWQNRIDDNVEEFASLYHSSRDDGDDLDH